LSPILHPESEDDWETDAPDILNEENPRKGRGYGKKLAGFDFNSTELSVSDSKKWGGEQH